MVAGNKFDKYIFRECLGHRKKVYALSWNITGKKLASGSGDQTVRIWSIEPFAVSKPERIDLELRGHTNVINNVAWSPVDQDIVASTSEDRTVRIWDVRSGKTTHNISTSGANLYLAWHPSGQTIAVVNKENAISFIDMRRGKVTSVKRFSQEVNEFAWNGAGSHFFMATGSGAVEVLEYPCMEPVWKLQAHTANCYCCTISKSQRYLATGGADALVTIWDLDLMACVKTIIRNDQPVRTLSFSSDAEYLAYAGEDATVDVVHVETGALGISMTCRTPCDSVAFNPCHCVLAFAADDKDGREGPIGILAPPKT